MISRRELKELAALRSAGNTFVSLYLNVDPKANPKSDYLLHLKNMSRDALRRLTPP
jgi:peptide subunit release factor 1 (eRF1)